MCIRDSYPLDHKNLIQKIRKAKHPLVVCRSKSGGAHVFLFTKDWVEAKDMQNTVRHLASNLGFGDCEIFPKQIALNLARGDVGNFLNIPYFDHKDGLRYVIKDDGTAGTIDEFFELYDTYVQTKEQMLSLTSSPKQTLVIADGPPCLQTLCSQKINEGGRNSGLFNLAVYLRKAFPDSWETEILNYNMQYLSPPLPLSEVNLVAKQLQKKEYGYKCKDAPINAYCNAELCKTRKFGIDSALTGATIANLRKYNSTPPVWFLDLNGQPLELDTEALMNQSAFQRACVDQLNYMPRSVSRQQWEARINFLLEEMANTEGSIVEVSQDASVQGQFYDYLEDFCTTYQNATSKEEILLRRPFVDEEENKTYFRLKDFEAFLRKNKFFEYKSHRIAQRLRDINGESVTVKIKGKSVRVWVIPSFLSNNIEVTTPDMGDNSRVPF